MVDKLRLKRNVLMGVGVRVSLEAPNLTDGLGRERKALVPDNVCQHEADCMSLTGYIVTSGSLQNEILDTEKR